MSSESDALQDALAAEHAATYLFALIGARTSEGGEPELYAALQAAYVEHRDRRDALIGQVAALGATPVGAAAAYTPQGDLTTTDGRWAAALALETGCEATYAALVGMTTGATRAEAIGFLDETAVRVLSFRGTPEIFPGADELADR